MAGEIIDFIVKLLWYVPWGIGVFTIGVFLFNFITRDKEFYIELEGEYDSDDEEDDYEE